jgi:hypothetical protein
MTSLVDHHCPRDASWGEALAESTSQQVPMEGPQGSRQSEMESRVL